MERPLVLCAHGTRSEAGRAAVRALVERVADVWPGVVEEAFVDVHGPTLGSVLRPGATVVPLLLSPGHHTAVDIAGAAATVSRRFSPPDSLSTGQSLGGQRRASIAISMRLSMSQRSPASIFSWSWVISSISSSE